MKNERTVANYVANQLDLLSELLENTEVSSLRANSFIHYIARLEELSAYVNRYNELDEEEEDKEK